MSRSVWKADLATLSIGDSKGIILVADLIGINTLSKEEVESNIALAAQSPALKEIAEAFLQYLQVREDDKETILINHIKHILNKTDVKFLKR